MAADAVKIVPFAGVSAANFFGMSVPDAINYVTLFCGICYALSWCWRGYVFARDKKYLPEHED